MKRAWIIVITRFMEHCDDKIGEQCDDKLMVHCDNMCHGALC